MREDESNWFSKWEDELPSPEELMPLSQTLISPDLALAFNIRNPYTPHNQHQLQPPPPPSSSVQTPNSVDFDFSDVGGVGSAAGSDEPARTLKRPRLVWTPELHKRFVEAVAHLGIKNAVPKTIMQLMGVDGLTRENVASHLQKYRLYLKRMQGISSGSRRGNTDPATDHLFASSPVPPHFLQAWRVSSDQFIPYTPPAAQQQHQQPHHHQMAVAAVAGNSQYGQMGRFGLQPNGQLEQPFLARPAQSARRFEAPKMQCSVPSYAEDIGPNTPANGRKMLTLFPAGV